MFQTNMTPPLAYLLVTNNSSRELAHNSYALKILTVYFVYHVALSHHQQHCLPEYY